MVLTNWIVIPCGTHGIQPQKTWPDPAWTSTVRSIFHLEAPEIRPLRPAISHIAGTGVSGRTSPARLAGFQNSGYCDCIAKTWTGSGTTPSNRLARTGTDADGGGVCEGHQGRKTDFGMDSVPSAGRSEVRCLPFFLLRFRLWFRFFLLSVAARAQ